MAKQTVMSWGRMVTPKVAAWEKANLNEFGTMKRDPLSASDRAAWKKTGLDPKTLRPINSRASAPKAKSKMSGT